MPTFGDDAKVWRKPVKDMADVFAAEGISTLLFDPSGCGESEGYGSIKHWISDVQDAMDRLASQSPRNCPLYAIGIGTGAAFLVLAGLRSQGYETIWVDPVLDIRTYFRDLFRRSALSDILNGCRGKMRCTFDGCRLDNGILADVAHYQSAVDAGSEGAEAPALWVDTQYHLTREARLGARTWMETVIWRLDIWPSGDEAGTRITWALLPTIGELGIRQDRGVRPSGKTGLLGVRLGTETRFGRHVSFPGPEGVLLRGMWHDAADNESVVIFLHGKGGYRIGPNRIFCDAAAELERRGFSSLRFDYRGRGDSDGRGFSTERALDERDIDRCVEDVLCAMDYAVSHNRRARIVLCGMCMGGYVALRALTKAPKELAGLCLLSPYLMGVENHGIAKWRQMLHTLGHYGCKSMQLRNWVRLIAGQASLGRVARAIFAPLGGTRRSPTVDYHRRCAVQSRLPCLQVFGQRDPLHSEVIRQIDQLYGVRLERDTVVVIKQADHNFSSPEARYAVIARICDYATRVFVNATQSSSR